MVFPDDTPIPPDFDRAAMLAELLSEMPPATEPSDEELKLIFGEW